ncbi:hypothetical protein C1H76_4356 [Elsinoe australis]|uniref:Uncharacterized protein n=1 Tax=Elsinoe australis TaxID=40998 RepID=A0A2P8AJ18_9PEZI|nr:hypothetical protein B9Z65_610 [Elsinoe australis]TKX23289.1 hypothetical protein C1H76_4356 [Elsinoe australis]
MKFSLTILAGLVGFAVAQSGSGTQNTASSTSTSLSPTQTCLNACAAGDVNCQAACLGNPFPNESQINATTECSMNCVQGNGTQAETEAYGQCLANCRASYFISTGTNFVGASATGAAGSSATGSGSSAPASGSASATGRTGSAASSASGAANTASGSASASASAGAAVYGATVQVAPFAGVMGLLMAALAL